MAEIKKIYTQSMPATRFIGVKYGVEDKINGNFGAKWDEHLRNNLFGKIQSASNADNFFEESGAYIGLMKYKPNEPFQYWIGMFTPPNTKVPDGLGYIDFPASEIGVGWVYGSDVTGDIYCKEEDVIDQLKRQGHTVRFDDVKAQWFFERYVCPRFTNPDEKGNVILDVCVFLDK